MAASENELVEWLQARLAADPARVPIGIGDDAAAVRTDGSLIVFTADMLLDGVHFDTRRHAGELIGRKAIACSLSDCAAMACEPRAATVSVALPQDMPLDDVKRLYEGMAGVAAEFDCPLVGGDITGWTGRLAIDVAMLAEPMSPRGPVRRRGARPGDTIYVSGPLGGSLTGHHLTFTPRLELARTLVREPGLHAMMDISDGLALDLPRLCTASECDAALTADQLDRVISDAARKCARSDNRSPREHALSDGEDFELLISGDDSLQQERFGLTAIGRIEPRASNDTSVVVLCHADGTREPVESRGYDHLRAKRGPAPGE